MTAGGWMYIGPQGIVHGTFNTLLNAGRLKLGIPNDKDLAGRLFISAGLGGMSGAQGKAAEIAGAASIIAEVDDSRIDTRYTQGWVSHRTDSLEEATKIALEHQKAGKPCAVAYCGNIVDLLEYLYEHNVHVDLMSDQTSCHVPYDGGYCPQGLTFAQRTEMLDKDPEGFRKLVDKTLQHHYETVSYTHLLVDGLAVELALGTEAIAVDAAVLLELGGELLGHLLVMVGVDVAQSVLDGERLIGLGQVGFAAGCAAIAGFHLRVLGKIVVQLDRHGFVSEIDHGVFLTF